MSGRTLGDLPGAILYLCGQNVIRSPMAAAITRSLFPRGIYCRSAGVRPGAKDPFVQAVLDEIQVDISTHQPHTFEALDDSNFDLIITLAPEAHHLAMELTRTQAVEVEYWPTADPSTTQGSRDQILSAYRTVRDNLSNRIKRRLDRHPAVQG